MPKVKVRSMIRAKAGYELLAFDLSQAESWVVAYEANEPNMKKALHYGDIHSQTAVALFHQTNVGCDHKWSSGTIPDSKICIRDDGCKVVILYDERYLGKKSNHASAYGMQPPRQAEVINAESDKPPYITVTVKQTEKMNAAWHSYYNIKSWWQSIQDELSNTRALTTAYGRRRTFFAAWGNELFKEAYAFKPQSTVADHFNGALHPELGIAGGFLELYRQHVRKGYYSIINHAHDSVLIHIPKPVPEDLIYEIRSIIERPLIVNGEQFTIPVDGERGERFGELEKIKWRKAA